MKGQGYVPSLRRGSTGIGYTFESMLGLKENNLAVPDIPSLEIKTHRDKSSSMITLFTFNSNAWKTPPLEAIKRYGSQNRKGRLGLYYTLSLTPNSAGLFLNIGDDEVSVQHTSGEIVATWSLSTLAERFEKKMPAVLLVSAHTEKRDGMEYFHFYRCQLLKVTSPELLCDLFRSGDLRLDLRLHDAGTKARNHGTGFRAISRNFHDCFGKYGIYDHDTVCTGFKLGF